MSDLHDLLVAESERLRPAAIPDFDALAGRARRRLLARLVAVGMAVVAIVGGATGIVLGAGHDGGRASVASAGPVISSGECAGLSITAELVGRPGRWPIQAGDQSAPIEMPPNYLMWLRASGPCVDRLRISASNDVIQTATGGVTSFNDQGIGIIVSQDGPGQARIRLLLACVDDENCAATEIATIPLTITDSTSPIPSTTTSPSESPSPTSSPVTDTPQCPQRTSQPSTNLQITATNKAGGWFDRPCLNAPRDQPLGLTFTNNVYTLQGHQPVTLGGVYVFRSSDLPRVQPGVPTSWDLTKAVAGNAGQSVAAGSTIQVAIPPLDPGTYTIFALTGYPQASATLTVS